MGETCAKAGNVKDFFFFDNRHNVSFYLLVEAYA